MLGLFIKDLKLLKASEEAVYACWYSDSSCTV